MSRFCLRAALLSVIVGTTPTITVAQSFMGMGLPLHGVYSAAHAVSDDGRVAAGICRMSGDYYAFRWSCRDGMEILDMLPGGTAASALELSGDGSVVTGDCICSQGCRAYRWTRAGGMRSLGSLSDTLSSFGWGISHDGATVVGNCTNGTSSEAFRWTQMEGMTRLGLPKDQYSVGLRTNKDGSVVMGRTNPPGDYQTFIWTRGKGLAIVDRVPKEMYALGKGLSGDGAVVVGSAESRSTQAFAFRWTAETGFENLGKLPGGTSSIAAETNEDGSVIVGCGDSRKGLRAIRWTAAQGMVDLNTYLPARGISLAGWVLTEAHAVSPDGLTFVGEGTHDGLTEAWIATLGPVAYADCVKPAAKKPSLQASDFACFLINFARSHAFAANDGDLSSFVNDAAGRP